MGNRQSVAWESLLTSLLHELPQPVTQDAARDGSLILVGGEPPEVIIRLTRSTAAVSQYDVDLREPHEPLVRPILLGSVHWRRVPEVHALSTIGALVRAARDARRTRYTPCRVCGRGIPPEWLTDDEVCEGCREER